MRWFRGRADKQFKNKYRVKNKPAAPEAPKPKYKSPAPTKRVPKLRKPRVDMPFVDAKKRVVAYDGPIDQSIHALRQLEDGSVKVKWVNQSGSDGCRRNECANLAASEWGSVGEFLEARNMAFPPEGRPSAGMEMGLYGHSHPGCDCYVVVTMQDGSSYKIGPEDAEPQLSAPPGSAQSSMSWASSTEKVEDELGSYGAEEEEAFW